MYNSASDSPRGQAGSPIFNGNGNGNGNGHVPTTDDRLPPQNLEAERWLLGSILLDNTVLDEVTRILTWEDFYREAHQVVYRESWNCTRLVKAWMP